MNTVGAAVQEVCLALKDKLRTLAAASNAAFATAQQNDVAFGGSYLTLGTAPNARVRYAALLKQTDGGLVIVESKPDAGHGKKYSMYSYSVHFAEVRVHPLTGEVRVSKLVSCADAGTVVNQKTAGNQMKGGAVGGIGMALMEASIIDNRYGRYITKDLADYHVPVHADAPAVEVYFVNQPDPHVNNLGTKGIGEIAIIGVAPAIANAAFNATGKRIRELPITPDKLVEFPTGFW